jgi:hypothetical protein
MFRKPDDDVPIHSAGNLTSTADEVELRLKESERRIRVSRRWGYAAKACFVIGPLIILYGLVDHDPRYLRSSTVSTVGVCVFIAGLIFGYLRIRTDA